MILKDYIQKKKDYLQTQVGNPEGADKPNKKVHIPSSCRALSVLIRLSLPVLRPPRLGSGGRKGAL